MYVVPWDKNGRNELLTHVKHFESLDMKTHVEELLLLPISPVLVRGHIGQGLLITGLISKAIEKYIVEHHLYGGIPNG